MRCPLEHPAKTIHSLGLLGWVFDGGGVFFLVTGGGGERFINKECFSKVHGKGTFSPLYNTKLVRVFLRQLLCEQCNHTYYLAEEEGKRHTEAPLFLTSQGLG